MTKECFILDTSVLLHDANCLKGLEKSRIIIPIYAIEELDTFKDEFSKRGKNARQISRILESLRKEGNLVNGVTFGNSTVQVLEATQTDYLDSNDNKILTLATEINKELNYSVVLLTRDINLRLKANCKGVKSSDCKSSETKNNFTGFYNFTVDVEIINALFQEKEFPLLWEVEENTFGVLNEGTQSSALVRFFPSENRMKVITKRNAWGIQPRNKEQHFALNLLLDPKIKLVTLIGPPGSGKTLLSVCTGLQKVVEEKEFQKFLVSRPIIPLGRDIGFLPGSIEEKLRPWIQPIYDSLDVLINLSEKEKKKGRTSKEFFDLGLIEIEPMTYIRGRSIPNQFILLDELQNTTPHEVKTFITRAGENTKIVLTGDISQIDCPYLDSENNGLVHVVNKFRGESIYGHITLNKSERSELAEKATQLL